MTTITNKEESLAIHLGIKTNEITQSKHDENSFEADGGEYLVLTDSEANAMARERILESVWAFNYSFLCAHSEAIAEIPEKDYQDMAGKLCESFNKAALAMIDDVEHFVADAIASDGRGHFISGYDGEENEQGEFYIYQTN